MTRGLGLAVTAAVLLTGCGVTSQPAPELVPRDRLPTTTAAPGANAQQVRIWVVRGERVVPVFVDRAGTGLRSRVEALLALDSADESLTSAVPPGSRLLRIVRQAGGVVELQLDEQLQLLDRPSQPLAVAQLVLTSTELPDVLAVRITSGGRLLSAPGPSGETLTQPLRRAQVAPFVQGALD